MCSSRLQDGLRRLLMGLAWVRMLILVCFDVELMMRMLRGRYFLIWLGGVVFLFVSFHMHLWRGFHQVRLSGFGWLGLFQGAARDGGLGCPGLAGGRLGRGSVE